MSPHFWLCCTLVLSCIYAETITNAEPKNVDIEVPLNLRNLNLTTTQTTSATNLDALVVVGVESTPTTSTVATAQKVPLRRNATENSNPFVQSPASLFLTNYNNQQNVMQLVRNVDIRLRNIRNDEMRIAMIQEIFDSLDFNSYALHGSYKQNRSGSVQQPQLKEKHSAASLLTQDLQIFSKRLSKKLQKATHVVQELRDFFIHNITKLSAYTTPEEFSEDEDVDVDFELEIDDFENSATEANKPAGAKSLYLHTRIESCQSANLNAAQNYNKQQIQIVNYRKTDDDSTPVTSHWNEQQNFLNENNARTLAANAFVVERLQTLKTMLTKADVYEQPLSATSSSNTKGKQKFLSNHFKHIYFLSNSDQANAPSERFYYDLHFRYLYAAAISNKYVCLLLDVGSAMNAELLELTKTYVSNILQLLSESDLVSIVTVSDEANNMLLDGVASAAAETGIFFATQAHKEEILSYVNSLSVAKALTNHSLGFEYTFKMLQTLENASVITPNHPIQFVYVTRGLLTNLSDAMHVLRVVANGQRSLQQPIIINTVAVVLDEKRIMYEKQFLSDIAMQNYTKYDINVSDWYANQQQHKFAGKFFVLTKMHPDTLMLASTAIMEKFFEEQYLKKTLEVHAPVIDVNSGDVIVSITHAVVPYGVVGVNLYLADLIEDAINYRQRQVKNNDDITYAFLIDRNGITLTHPAFPRPLKQSPSPFPVDIGYLENATNFAYVRRRMLTQESGNCTANVYRTLNKKQELMERTYQWQSVLGIYILCLVTTTKKLTPTQHAKNAEKSVAATTLPMHLPTPAYLYTSFEHLPALDLLYHRLDLLTTTTTTTAHVCRYFRQMATFDTATLFLSSAAFESPFTFLYNNRVSAPHSQMRTVESIMAYLKDSTGLLANPGLRPQIRFEVNALYNAMLQLRQRHQDARGSLKRHIIRRYIATVNGVLQVYPGCLLGADYDATRRAWFRKAMQQPGKIITTAPYLDAAGAGHIITIAQTIFEGKANALHSIERDQPVAVVALDLPYAYYYRMILDTTSLCQRNNIKCLLFDNEGYLIAHPTMLEPSTLLKNPRRPHEHLTHKESYLANDILNHKTLVRKFVCANYQNRTLQRYYVFNTSLVEILSNVVQGERTKYAISLVRGSNLFAAVLNASYDGGAFCPCSTIDRVCLNCKRMDQMDCECPCECPMDVDELADALETGVVGGHDQADEDALAFSNYTQQYLYCAPPNEHFLALPTLQEQNSLPVCMSVNCDIYFTQNECLAMLGCEWCQQDLDGNAYINAFCATQAACFNGVLSSLTPYGDLDDVDIITAHGYNPGQKPNAFSAFGPVCGAIGVLAVVIGFAIYCYRHSLDAHAQDQFYIDSMQEENYGLPLSRFNFDDCQAHDEPPGSAYDHPAAQRNLIHPGDISPYHMSTGSSYRRPPNNESDHGYSTMTPHEDSSDHQCFTLAEPLLLHDKRHSKADTVSISTSISSPTNRQQQQHYSNHKQNSYLNQVTSPATTTLKDARYNLTSPKKYHHGRVYEQTTLPLHAPAETTGHTSPNYILAPVTVHRHMETSES